MCDQRNGRLEPLLSELETLTAETFQLWDEVRVGFSWRHYFMNHTLRVRSNALAIGEREGADPDALAFAATLHDITKRYDGPYKVDAGGRRVVSPEGFWVNETLLPKRKNEVTRLYDRLGLYGRVHHDSGAEIARALLERRDADAGFAARVAHIVRGHLRPPNPPWTPGGPDDPYRDPESRSLVDADTIDANLGAVAFYRHVHIHGYRAIVDRGGLDLYAYVDALAEWVRRKAAFVGTRLTETGKEVAAARYEVDRRILRWLEEERSSPEALAVGQEFGMMAFIDFLLGHWGDPNMRAELKEAKEVWLPDLRARVAADDAPTGADEALQRVEVFLELLDGEIRGAIEQSQATSY